MENRFCRDCGTLLSQTRQPHRFGDHNGSKLEARRELDKKPSKITPPRDFSADDIQQEINRTFPDADEIIVARRDYPEQYPCYAEDGLHLANDIKLSLKRQGLSIEKLYSHQGEAINAALDGKNVVLSTQTASGKTICFNVPVLDSIVRDASSRALYIYPTRALAQDQIRKIGAFGDDYPNEERYTIGFYFTMTVGGRKIPFGKYDGATPETEKRRIRSSQCNLVLTNPDMLHFGILRWNWLWSDFLKHLKYVVVDEIHAYKGVFGSNVALVLRRLRKICDSFGADPKFILCSATIPNAREHAESLTGLRDFVVVENDGSPHKKRTLLLWNPPIADPSSRERREPLTNIIDILTKVLMTRRRLAKTIVFGRARSTVKNAYRLAQLRFRSYGTEQLSELIREYTATLLPERREEIFKELTTEKICTIIGTNALELGIDIPNMSCYLSIGYPGSMTSLRQQFGRVGRVGDGLGIIVLQNEPLEQYFARNPEEFFNKEPEVVKINPGNPELLERHLACCAYELDRHEGLTDSNCRDFFGQDAEVSLERLAERGLILPQETRSSTRLWRFNSGEHNRNDAYLPIRNSFSKDNCKIMCNGKSVGVMDSASVLRDLHPSAIWTDQDTQYEVTEVNLDANAVSVRRVDVDYYTFSVPKDTVSVIKEQNQKTCGISEITFGKVEVKREVLQYSEVIPGRDDKDKPKWKDIQWGNRVPSRIFQTESLWLTLPNDQFDGRIEEDHFEGGLHAVEHAMTAMVPKWINSDPGDLSGTYELVCKATDGKPTIFIYDNFPGGVGLAKACFDKIDSIIADCIELIETCQCDETEGCPSCIQTTRCQQRNEPLDKNAALLILRTLCSAVQAGKHPAYREPVKETHIAGEFDTTGSTNDSRGRTHQTEHKDPTDEPLVPGAFVAEDGHRVRSRGELLIDNWLYRHQILHAYEKVIYDSKGAKMRCDFYLPDSELYLEYWGLEDENYKRRRKEKEDLYQRLGLSFSSVENEDMHDLDAHLGRLLAYGSHKAKDETHASRFILSKEEKIQKIMEISKGIFDGTSMEYAPEWVRMAGDRFYRTMKGHADAGDLDSMFNYFARLAKGERGKNIADWLQKRGLPSVESKYSEVEQIYRGDDERT